MEVPNLYSKIVSDSETTNILTWPYDFEIVKPYSIELESDIVVDDQVIIIAKDGTGGLFTLWGKDNVEKRPIVYISSEGQAGKIAKSFNEFILILVTCPFWFWTDLFKFSGESQLAEMRKALLYLQTAEEYIEVGQSRDILVTKLSLNPQSIDPVAKIHESINSKSEIKVRSICGEPFDSF
ncbi:hypothetical protein SAMN04487866_101161 [Thermoactinomyces sp. DSM 45891]|uniref:SMI1/KNR4 family protein n=1 Tax=Thermoactinomyces sp. DSM 45891 TaxID=1761907 RepID=UPI000923B6A5|nr:hypothetical protein [Thermoactinomyces sp. DSM 45891]SFX00566.1 hypothetical protein SAMN04487866_101161 [Thermoactinomyces sp. DSM 45891]